MTLSYLRLLRAIRLILLFDLAAALYLNHIHIQTILLSSFESICNISKTVSCDSALQTQYAYLFDIPMAYLGLIFYLISIVFTFFGQNQRQRSTAYALTLMSVGAVSASFYMAFVSFFLIKTLCLFCAFQYILNLLWLTTCVFLTRTIPSNHSDSEESAATLFRQLSILGVVAISIAITAIVGIKPLVFPKKPDPKSLMAIDLGVVRFENGMNIKLKPMLSNPSLFLSEIMTNYSTPLEHYHSSLQKLERAESFEESFILTPPACCNATWPSLKKNTKNLLDTIQLNDEVHIVNSSEKKRLTIFLTMRSIGQTTHHEFQYKNNTISHYRVCASRDKKTCQIDTVVDMNLLLRDFNAISTLFKDLRF